MEPGIGADSNAALPPDARTLPRPEKTASEWLRGEQAEEVVDAAKRAAAASQEAAVPPSEEEVAELDVRIRTLEAPIAEAEVEPHRGPDRHPRRPFTHP